MKEGFDSIPQPIYISILRGFLEALIRHLGDNLVSVILFGSVARGEADYRKSDMDLYIVARRWPPYFNERFKALEEAFKDFERSEEYRDALARGIHVSFSKYPLSIKEALRTGPLDLEVCIDGIILYDKEDFAKRKFKELELRLKKLGARREVGKGGRFWVLKPKVGFGEVIEV